MNAIRILAVLGAVIGLSGCMSTTYREVGFFGGVEARQMTADTYNIIARGNGYTSDATIQDYAILKAAETTIAAGGTHFVVLGVEDTTRTSVGQTAGYGQVSVYGNTAYGTYSPGYTYPIVKPGQQMLIQVILVRSGNAPQGAISAAEVVAFIGPRVRRPPA